MKPILVLVACTVLFTTSAALADNRVFIIANQPDGYGIDECLARGDKCGAHAALSYCQSREFAEATAYRRLAPDDVTASIPTPTRGNCRGPRCGEYVAITCHR